MLDNKKKKANIQTIIIINVFVLCINCITLITIVRIFVVIGWCVSCNLLLVFFFYCCILSLFCAY